VKFAVIRVPFFLEPDYDEDKPFIGTNRERLIKKWGGKAGWERQKLAHNLKGRGIEAGIPYFNLDRKTSSTMASHRLIQYVGKKFGLVASEALYDCLNVYYFVEGHALNDRPRLAKVSSTELKKLGHIMSEEDILDFLNSQDGREEIENARLALQRLGVHSIPKFIVEGNTLVDGAAHWTHHVEVFREIESRRKVAGGPIFGEILGIDKEVIEAGSHEKLEGMTS